MAAISVAGGIGGEAGLAVDGQRLYSQVRVKNLKSVQSFQLQDSQGQVDEAAACL